MNTTFFLSADQAGTADSASHSSAPHRANERESLIREFSKTKSEVIEVARRDFPRAIEQTIRHGIPQYHNDLRRDLESSHNSCRARDCQISGDFSGVLLFRLTRSQRRRR